MLYIVVLLFIIFVSVQIPGFFKKKLFRELIVFLMITAFALVYSISGLTDWHLPGPAKLAEIIFKPVSQIIFNNR